MSELNSDADLIEDLGKYLQKKREERDISVKTLAARTRIPLRFIESMEVNRFDDLPNAVSARGFLRSYADFVGADYTRILEAFSKLGLPFAPTENQDKILSYLHVKKTSRLPFPRRVAFSVGGVILLLLVLASLLPKKEVLLKPQASLPIFSVETLQPSKLPTRTEPPLQKIEPLEVPPLEAPIESLIEGESIVSGMEVSEATETEAEAESLISRTATTSESETEAETKEKLSVLSIEAIEPSWVQVKIDDLETREALLQPGDSVRWKAKEKFLLTLGNAGGVKVSLDGLELASFGPTGEVVSKEILISEPNLEQSE